MLRPRDHRHRRHVRNCLTVRSLAALTPHDVELALSAIGGEARLDVARLLGLSPDAVRGDWAPEQVCARLPALPVAPAHDVAHILTKPVGLAVARFLQPSEPGARASLHQRLDLLAGWSPALLRLLTALLWEEGMVSTEFRDDIFALLDRGATGNGNRNRNGTRASKQNGYPPR